MLALVGCYAPKAAPGVLCDPALDNCPSGQTCAPSGADFVCVVPGAAPVDAPAEAVIDAAPDGALDLDSDGDGIMDAVDNCPLVANPQQFNEDGDRFGDDCDPCPPIADDAPPDQDNDGVADACDPRPTQGGDSIALFEGFHTGVPPTWFKRGTWTAAADAVTVESMADPGANLTVPGPTTQHETVATGLTILDITPMAHASAGVVDTWTHTATKRGVFCHLTTWFDPADGSYFRPLETNQLGSAGQLLDYEMATNTPYIVWQRRDATSYTCNSMKTNGVITTTPANTSGLGAAQPEIGIRAVHARVRYAWVLVIRN